MTPKDTSAIKPMLINPAYANHVAESFGLSGELAKKVGESLSKKLCKQFDDENSYEDLLRMIKRIINEDFEKVFAPQFYVTNWRDALNDEDDDD